MLVQRGLAIATPKAQRRVWFGGWVDTPVYWRDHLPLDPGLTGPCIIEQMDTTIVIEPGCTVSSDMDGNLIASLDPLATGLLLAMSLPSVHAAQPVCGRVAGDAGADDPDGRRGAQLRGHH